MPDYTVHHATGYSWQVNCSDHKMLLTILLNRLSAEGDVKLDTAGVIDWIQSGPNKLEIAPTDVLAEKSLALLDAAPATAFPEGAPVVPTTKKHPSYWVNYYLTWIANVPKPKFDKADKQYNKVKWPLDQLLLLLKGCLIELKCREPKIHSGIEEKLPAHHPLAFAQVHCEYALPAVENLGQWCADPNIEVEKKPCRKLLHAGNNEHMTPWVETGDKNYCLQCWLYAATVADATGQSFDMFALKEE